MQALRGVSLLQVGLTILHDGSLAQHRFSACEVAAGDVDHGRLEVDEGKLGIEVHGAGQRLKSFFTPSGMREPELIAPVRGLERDRPPCLGQRLGCAAGAHQEERQRRVGLGQVALEIDRAPDVVDRAREQGRIGLVVRARHLVLPEPRVSQPDVGDRITRIHLDGAFETCDCGRNQRGVERFEPHPSLREGLVRLEAAGLADRSSRASVTMWGHPKRVRKLRDQLVLQIEDLREGAIGFCLRDSFARCRVDHARGDPKPIAGALEAADHGAIEVQLRAKARQIGTAALDGLHDAHAIDHAERRRCPEIVGHRLGDPRCQPRELSVTAHVRKIQHRNGRLRIGGSHRHGLTVRQGLHPLRAGVHGRDETVAAPCHRLDVGRLRRIVAKRLTQLGHGLRERIVGHGNVGPERLEQLVL